jgi:hypothetical protein
MTDPIVDEVRRVRDENATRFNYDLDAMVSDLREQQKRSGRTFVDYSREGAALPASETKDKAGPSSPPIQSSAPAAASQ